MLIFIENTPRAYAWGSREALPDLLGVEPSGEPQAELWLGAHPNAPASVAKATPERQTLIDLIAKDPDRYGVNGGQLPFLFKVLGIGAPLSLQVHPDKQQAEEGFAREEAAGLPRDARNRNYGDDNHKPELLVALSEVSALCGFRPLPEAVADLQLLVAAVPAGKGREALEHAVQLLSDEDHAARRALLSWALGGSEAPAAAVHAIGEALTAGRVAAPLADPLAAMDEHRRWSLLELINAYPRDPGVLISVLLHLVRLQPRQAVYLGARQLHAYLGGIAVEVMAASDNVLRAGLTEKHVDSEELMRVVDFSTLPTPRIEPDLLAPGLIAWQPCVSDFKLLRACLHGYSGESPHDIEDDSPDGLGGIGESTRSGGFGGSGDLGGLTVSVGSDVAEPNLHPWCSESVTVDAEYPLVLIVTNGRVRVDRLGDYTTESSVVARGHSLYISAGAPVELSGVGEAFVAGVGVEWKGVSQPSR